jgi:hypothetical protein
VEQPLQHPASGVMIVKCRPTRISARRTGSSFEGHPFAGQQAIESSDVVNQPSLEISLARAAYVMKALVNLLFSTLTACYYSNFLKLIIFVDLFV